MKYLITLPGICLWIILLCLSKAGSAQAKTYPVEAVLGGVKISTTVDSPFALQLLTGQGSALSVTEVAELQRALHCNSLAQLPGRDILRELSREYSPDTAMTLLIRCLLENPLVGETQRRYQHQVDEMKMSNEVTQGYLAARADEYIVLFVPGWGYKDSADETGSDLRLPRQIIERQGFETQLVALESNGSVEGGAAILAQTLQPLLEGNKKIILFSASSGGPIVAEVLSIPEIGHHPRLRGWLNICGVLHGSPVIDKLLFWPGTWVLRGIALFEGWNYRDFISLSRLQSGPRIKHFQPPEQLTIINYIGTPLSGQISKLGKFFYGLLKDQGPNDGLTYITEAIAPGHTVLGIGVDHFVMQDPALDAKIEAFMPVMLTLIEQ